jgi:pimeloyl-ACP methyl ester carboxylesterase
VLIFGLLAAGFIYEKVSELSDARHYPVPGKMVEVRGHAVQILCKGDGIPAVVIETGAGTPSFQWWDVQNKIAAFTKVCTYDRPGYGWSQPATSRTLEQREEELHVLLSNAHIDPPYILVGHSYGGLLVRLFANQHPTEVVGIVLVDAADSPFYREPQNQLVAQLKRQLRFQIWEARFGVLRFELRKTPDLAAAYAPPRQWLEMWDEFSSTHPFPDTLTTPESETLGATPLVVIRHGLRTPDLGVPEDHWQQWQENLAKLSSNSKIVIAEESDHSVQLHQPYLIVHEVQELIDAARARGEHSPPL